MKSFERQNERNVEQDRRTFMEGISTTLVEEIPTAFDETTVRELTENLADTNLFIFGETHGVKENADIIYTLFKKFGFRQLALEWEPSLKEVVEKFLQSGELDFDAIKESPDGRITAGHFALIKKLRSEGILEGLVCFDGGSDGEGWNARDAAMAKNILASLSDGPTLVVAGHYHAKTESFTFDDEPEEKHPLGKHVKKEISNMPSGEIKYLSGQFHNFGTKEFENVIEEDSLPEARFFRGEDSLYVFELPQAHAAIVPNPEERI